MIKIILYMLVFVLLINCTANAARQIRVGSRINNSTPDSLLFIDLNNRLAEDNANLSWDDTNKRLSIGNLLIQTSNTPLSPSDTGIQGQLEWDGSYIYVCIATDTWKRTNIVTWAVVDEFLLLESGDFILLETGDRILLE